MRVLIFAPPLGAGEEMQSALGDAADHYTLADTWTDLLSSIKNDRPDLILIERTALARLEPTTLLNLVEPGCSSPLMFIDAPHTVAEKGSC